MAKGIQHTELRTTPRLTRRGQCQRRSRTELAAVVRLTCTNTAEPGACLYALFRANSLAGEKDSPLHNVTEPELAVCRLAG